MIVKKFFMVMIKKVKNDDICNESENESINDSVYYVYYCVIWGFFRRR